MVDRIFVAIMKALAVIAIIWCIIVMYQIISGNIPL